MAEILKIKPWQTSTAGENLFLFIYQLIDSSLSTTENELIGSYSSFGTKEFFRLTAAMELMHRCINTGVTMVSTRPDISSAIIGVSLKDIFQTRPINGSVAKLAELTRLSSIAYVRRNLPNGLGNSIRNNKNSECCWCGKITSSSKNCNSSDKTTVEHLWPEFLGGESVEDNLIIACGACNSARQHAYTWAWFGVQACNEKLDLNKSLPREIKLSIALHRLISVASGQTRYSNEIITLKEAATRLHAIIPEIPLIENTRYTFLEILTSAKE